MTVDRGAPYYLRVGSKWKHLAAVGPGVQVTPSRPTSFFTTLGNIVYADVADVVKRAWGFAVDLEDAKASRWLDYAASHPNAEVWLWDENLSKVNMLAASLTEGTSATLIDVDGVAMPTFAPGGPKLPISTHVRAGRSYHLSYTTTREAGGTVGSVSVNGSLRPFVAPSGFGARRGSTSFRADTDQIVGIGWSGDGVTTAARLTEGSVDDHGFLPSRGETPCRVLVGDPSTTYKMAWADRLALADSTYVLTEVG